VDNAFPRDDCNSIRATRDDLASAFVLTFLSKEVDWERTETEDVLKDVSVAFSLAGARLPTLALGRLAKSLAGWFLDGLFFGGAIVFYDDCCDWR
jgi:hypothetical protein